MTGAIGTQTATVPLWLVGARGMLAGELLRLLEAHPGLSLQTAVSRDPAQLASAHPNLAPTFGAEGDATLGETAQDLERAADALHETLARGERAALVLALPHGESTGAWAKLRARLGDAAENLFLVDLSADYRLRDPAAYQAAYGREHPDPLELEQFVYGLPELQRACVQGARRVAAPGCFASALQFAVLPTASADVLDASRPWLFNGVTGSSGSGAEPKPTTHHPFRHGNLWAYGLGGHRHEAELHQTLQGLGISAPIHFLPCSGPFARGIHLTASLPLARAWTTAQAHARFAEHYAGEPFVEVVADGVPDLRRVVGSNKVALKPFVRGDVLNVLVTLDNLIKGGAGQALQCLNLMLGFPETWGLPRSGLGVC